METVTAHGRAWPDGPDGRCDPGAHFRLLQQPEMFGVPMWALWVRLPIQVGLIWLIGWSTTETVAR